MTLAKLLWILHCACVSIAIELSVGGSGGNATSLLQYGLMFEDINHSGDGGIYAELIRNRAFQAQTSENATIYPWQPSNSTLEISTSNPLSTALPYAIKVTPSANATSSVGLSNPGWWGIAVSQQIYTGSFWVSGTFNGTIIASLESNITMEVFATKSISVTSESDKWSQYNFTLEPQKAASDTNNSFSLHFVPSDATDGFLTFQLLSLFPPTYKDRPNGMRVELMSALKALNPSFLRMPGGNNIEGDGPQEQNYRWKWNETIGPLRDRPGREGTWNYMNTDGLGLAEYLDWCEDLEMEPLLAVWDGHYLDNTVTPEDQLQPYVDDVLNELEYILGSTDTTYGALRASNGRAEPWKVSYVEIGNEDNLSDGTDSYIAYRYAAFYDAIHSAYPDITIISSTVLNVPEVTAGNAADYHIYARPDQLVSLFNLLDQNSTESQVKTLLGEYACVQVNDGETTGSANFSEARSDFPFWIGTVAEAVFLLGAERNGGSVLGASYAPTIQNLNEYQWIPDMISFYDPTELILSTSYSMVQLLSGTRITETLPVASKDGEIGPLYWVAGRGTNNYIMKFAVYNSTDSADVPVTASFEDLAVGTTANLKVLTAPDAMSYSTASGNPVVENTTMLTYGDDGFSFSLPDLSIAVLEVNTASNAPGISAKHYRPFIGTTRR